MHRNTHRRSTTTAMALPSHQGYTPPSSHGKFSVQHPPPPLLVTASRPVSASPDSYVSDSCVDTLLLCPPYRPTPVSGIFSDGTLSLQAITAIPFYENLSFEEIRWMETQRHRPDGVHSALGPPQAATPPTARERFLMSREDVRAAVTCGAEDVRTVQGAWRRRDVDPLATPHAKKQEWDIRCVICLDQRKTVIFFPCKHMCICVQCGTNGSVRSCPLCRAEIAIKTEVFW